MPTTRLEGHQIHVDDEGFMVEPGEWSEELAAVLAAQIGITLTNAHWVAIRFLRSASDSIDKTDGAQLLFI